MFQADTFSTQALLQTAVTLYGPGPGRFTVSRSVSAGERSLLAAAGAALLLNERFMDTN